MLIVSLKQGLSLLFLCCCEESLWPKQLIIEWIELGFCWLFPMMPWPSWHWVWQHPCMPWHLEKKPRTYILSQRWRQAKKKLTGCGVRLWNFNTFPNSSTDYGTSIKIDEPMRAIIIQATTGTFEWNCEVCWLEPMNLRALPVFAPKS